MTSQCCEWEHWSCVNINLETGDGLYVDPIEREVHAISKTHLATFLSCSQNSINKKRAQLWTFLCGVFY